MVIELKNNNNKTKQAINRPFFETGLRLKRVDLFLHLCRKQRSQNAESRGPGANRRSASMNRRYHMIPLVLTVIQCDSCPIQASKQFYRRFDLFFFCIESNYAIQIGNRTIPTSMYIRQKPNVLFICSY